MENLNKLFLRCSGGLLVDFLRCAHFHLAVDPIKDHKVDIRKNALKFHTGMSRELGVSMSEASGNA